MRVGGRGRCKAKGVDRRSLKAEMLATEGRQIHHVEEAATISSLRKEERGGPVKQGK